MTLRYSALAALAAAGAVAVAAELLAAALTLALDTPEVTGVTVARLLPPAVLYDLVLMPRGASGHGAGSGRPRCQP